MDTVLKKNTKESCGCLLDLVGKRFGKLFVLCKDGQDNYGNTIWTCRCECGKYLSVAHNKLTSKNVQSCGCLRKSLTKERFSKFNKFSIDNEYGIGYTTNTNNKFYFDLEDFHLISNYTWFEDTNEHGYRSLKARDKESGKLIKMSYLLGFKNHDHINRNPLDNRKSNFRSATAQENARNRSLSSKNTSGYIGVSWDKECLKWAAYIKIDGHIKRIGRFVNKEDAIRARLKAEVEYFKEFAPQRHLFKEYGIEDDFLEE